MNSDDEKFNEFDKDKLLNSIINTNYGDEDEVWNLALELEHNSIVLRRKILEQNNE